jgi:hypothetical protein
MRIRLQAWMIERLPEVHGVNGMNNCTSTGRETSLCIDSGLREYLTLKREGL